MLKWSVLAAVGVLFLTAAGPSVLARAGSLGDRAAEVVARKDGGGQSASQLAPGEFAGLAQGTAAEEVRELVGEPESRHSTEVEGVRLECWYYGIAQASGVFQLCFTDGALSSRLRYDALTG